MAHEPFSVDLANPEDIRAKMPEIRQLYREKRDELKALTEQVEVLARLVGDRQKQNQRVFVGGGQTRGRAGQNAPAQDRAVAALERANRPMGPTSLYAFMEAEGMELPANANALGANLYAAWKAQRIMKAPNGVYTPLDGTGRTEWDRPLTDYDWMAMNVPDAPQPEARPGLVIRERDYDGS